MINFFVKIQHPNEGYVKDILNDNTLKEQLQGHCLNRKKKEEKKNRC